MKKLTVEQVLKVQGVYAQRGRFFMFTPTGAVFEGKELQEMLEKQDPELDGLFDPECGDMFTEVIQDSFGEWTELMW